MSKSKIKFSVVVPLFNKLPFIGATLSSVFAQNYNDFEIIVVDDGSCDGSFSAANAFSDNRLRVFRKPNGGVSSARNFGVTQARNEWIAFLDADDLWKPDHLSHLSYLIEKFPGVSMVSGGSRAFDAASNDVSDYSRDTKYKIHFNYFRYAQKPTFGVNSSSVAIKRSIFSQVGYFLPVDSGEDIEMWARIAIRNKVAFSNYTTSFYRKNNAQSLSSAAEKRFLIKRPNVKSNYVPTPVIVLLKEHLDNTVDLDRDISNYLAYRLKIGLKVRMANGQIYEAKAFLNEADWKRYCSPCVFDLIKYVPVSFIKCLLQLRAIVSR